MTQQAHRYGNLSWDGLGVVYAAMHDTGNFVLASQDGGYLWQSLDHPTDTILPTQTMSLGSKLVARYSERNNYNGRLQFALQTNGNLASNFSIPYRLV